MKKILRLGMHLTILYTDDYCASIMIFRISLAVNTALHQAAISPLQLSLIVVSCHE